jgi:hypothetical protein
MPAFSFGERDPRQGSLIMQFRLESNNWGATRRDEQKAGMISV